MVQLQESGHYDDAVRVVENWMNQHQNDTSHNDFLHVQIAFIYISKAYRDKSTRDESLDNAAAHLEQALNLYAAEQPEDVDATLFEIGGAYEILGDLSQKDKCRFYGKARTALEEQLPLIKGDSYTAYGKTMPLEPLRVDIRKHLTSVEGKSAQAGCSALIVCPGAETVRWQHSEGTEQVAYQLKVEYPADSIIACISKKLSENGWQPLTEDFWNPGLLSSRVRGWSQFTDATVRPEATVDSWATQWQNQAGDVVWYFLQYRYPPQDRHTLSVNAGLMPADKAKNEPKMPQIRK